MGKAASNKKIIIISISVVCILAVVIAAVVFFVTKNRDGDSDKIAMNSFEALEEMPEGYKKYVMENISGYTVSTEFFDGQDNIILGENSTYFIIEDVEKDLIVYIEKNNSALSEFSEEWMVTFFKSKLFYPTEWYYFNENGVEKYLVYGYDEGAKTLSARGFVITQDEKWVISFGHVLTQEVETPGVAIYDAYVKEAANRAILSFSTEKQD